jgi:hypothetical protein
LFSYLKRELGQEDIRWVYSFCLRVKNKWNFYLQKNS